MPVGSVPSAAVVSGGGAIRQPFGNTTGATAAPAARALAIAPPTEKNTIRFILHALHRTGGGIRPCRVGDWRRFGPYRRRSGILNPFGGKTVGTIRLPWTGSQFLLAGAYVDANAAVMA